ncbi:hypothetical protein MC885_002264 [Smutsia gigantea]|nr:hypothetical protein MC885_002264 [Smutsia gigantea]
MASRRCGGASGPSPPSSPSSLPLPGLWAAGCRGAPGKSDSSGSPKETAAIGQTQISGFGPQTAAARAFLGLSSLGLPIPLATREDARPTSGEEKKKNLSEGFRQPTLTLFPQNQTSRGSHPNTGESSFGADSPLGFGGGSRAGGGISSVLNLVERIAGAQKSLCGHRGGAALCGTES